MAAPRIGSYSLPRVSAETRERIARLLDDIGPEARTADVLKVVELENPELLDMARRWAADVGDAQRLMQAFAIFYSLLHEEWDDRLGVAAGGSLPRVSGDSRDALVRMIDAHGPSAFVMDGVEHLERYNPELLRATHSAACACSDYLPVMQGFVLFYMALLVQLRTDLPQLH